jgi:glucose/arabinose dehydrogenase
MMERKPMNLRLLIIIFLCLVGFGCHNGGGDGMSRDDNEDALIRLERVLPNLSFASPVLFLQHPTLNDIFYVVEQGGMIWRTDIMAGTRAEFVDLNDYYNLSTCGECGLLGMAFHPDFDGNGYIYLSFMEGSGGGLTSYVARFHSGNNGASLDGAPERLNIFSVAQPYTNHNGGHIAFGQDNLLYLGLGDGGDANDPGHRAQDVDEVLGKMLRMNDDGSAADTNNYADLPGDDRIYAIGMRNPWRWSFDSLTGELWVGDVGQGAYEEVDIIENGGNYGWRCREGRHATPGIPTPCALTGGSAINPVAEYGRNEGSSITGGYVYRGSDLSMDYDGAYIFGDYVSGRIWALFPDGNGDYDRRELLHSSYNISSFGQDRDGELYVIDYGGGRIYRIFEND